MVANLLLQPAFEAMPANYDQQLNEIRQAYPPPKQAKE